MKDPTSAHENSTVTGSCVAAVVPYALNLARCEGHRSWTKHVPAAKAVAIRKACGAVQSRCGCTNFFAAYPDELHFRSKANV